MSDAPPKRKRLKRLISSAPGELRVEWGKDDCDNVGLVFLHGGYGAYGGHSHALIEAFYKYKVLDDMNLIDYLKDNGFDITTLKFSVAVAEPRAHDGSLPPGHLRKSVKSGSR
jgi:hypothetical protein